LEKKNILSYKARGTSVKKTEQVKLLSSVAEFLQEITLNAGTLAVGLKLSSPKPQARMLAGKVHHGAELN